MKGTPCKQMEVPFPFADIHNEIKGKGVDEIKTKC